MLHFVGRASAFSDSFWFASESRPKNDLHFCLECCGGRSSSVSGESAIGEDFPEDIYLKLFS